MGEQVTGIDCFAPFYARGEKERNLAPFREHKNFAFVELDAGQIVLPAITRRVFHLAATPGVQPSWGETFGEYVYNNIMVTKRLLDEALLLDGLESFVFASSSSVYGWTNAPVSVMARPMPASPYGATKLAAENLVSMYGKEKRLPTVSLRLFSVYGPRQRPDLAFRRFIKAILAGGAVTIYGDGEQGRDWTYVSDVVQAFLAITSAPDQIRGPVPDQSPPIQSGGTRGGGRDTEPGMAYNVVRNDFAKVNQVLTILEKLLGPFKIIYKPIPPGDVRGVQGLGVIPGWEPQVWLREGLEKQIEWQRAL